MIDEDFFGRTISIGRNSFEILNCEVCLQKSATWVEIIGDPKTTFVLRMTCHNCHDEFLSKIKKSESVSREMGDLEEKIEHSIRPGWVDEFIDSNENIEIVSANESETHIEEKDLSETENWIKGFIEESLFGSDPIGWLEKKELFSGENVENVVMTLGELSSNELTNVKLSAIQCLYEIYLRNMEMKDQIIQNLTYFLSDENDIIIQFAQENINKC